MDQSADQGSGVPVIGAVSLGQTTETPLPRHAIISITNNEAVVIGSSHSHPYIGITPVNPSFAIAKDNYLYILLR